MEEVRARGLVAREYMVGDLGFGSVHDRPGIRGMLHCGTTAHRVIRSCRVGRAGSYEKGTETEAFDFG